MPIFVNPTYLWDAVILYVWLIFTLLIALKSMGNLFFVTYSYARGINSFGCLLNILLMFLRVDLDRLVRFLKKTSQIIRRSSSL